MFLSLLKEELKLTKLLVMKKRVLFFILLSISVFSFAQQMCLTQQEKELIQLINSQRTDLGYSEDYTNVKLQFITSVV